MERTYETKSGYVLLIGALDRRRIDQFLCDHPLPKPPTRDAVVFGGEVESVDVLDDPLYLRQCERHYINLFHEQLSLIADAIEFPIHDSARQQMRSLYHTGIEKTAERTDILRHIILAHDADAANVVQAVLYNSTVTTRGINEANDRFAVMWHGSPLKSWGVRSSPAEHGLLYESWRAARYAGFNWIQFCKLTGPEQSEVVAFYRSEMRLQWLTNK